jgi:predicted enzyme related to lactoylglutathione lyase
MPTGIRKPGQFCWVNMLSRQPAAEREFFGKLFGWTYAEVPGMGHRMKVGGREIGAIFDVAGPNNPSGMLPHIRGLVKVDNADATCEHASSLGGHAKPVIDLGDQGRIATCIDPNGAHIVIWETNKSPGTDVDSTQHGAPSWFETLTTEVDLARKFYCGLFGWTTEIQWIPGLEYTTFKLGAEYVAGMMKIRPDMADGTLTPHWGVYFTVNDADATARDALALGAELCVPLRDIPRTGRFCGITSPQGVTFYVIKYTS